MPKEGRTPSRVIHPFQEMFGYHSQKHFESSKISFVNNDQVALDHGVRVLETCDIAFGIDTIFDSLVSALFATIRMYRCPRGITDAG
jgi:hypothetical protein